MIKIIAAVGKNLELGNNNQLLWNLPTDMKFFKETTMGHPVIMGRKTYESIGRPLPGRRNIVLSNSLNDEKVEVVDSIEKALALVQGEDVFVIGGAQIYQSFLEYADFLYLTMVDDNPKADVYFPKFDEDKYTKEVLEEHFENNLNFKFVLYRRKNER